LVGAGNLEDWSAKPEHDRGARCAGPFRMGYDAVKTALAASKGEQVPAQVYIDASLITKANMNSAVRRNCLT